MNKIFLSGNFTRDVEVNTYGKTTVAKTAIAVPRNHGEAEHTDFIELTAFNKTAEFMSKYFQKGSRVILEGRFQQSEYTTAEGYKRKSYEVIIEKLEFGGGKKSERSAPPDEEDDPGDMPF